MEIRIGSYRIENGTKKAIIEYVFDGYIIYVFKGDISDFDILVKYRHDKKRVRTPRHVHWAVDILLKLQGSKRVTRKFVKRIKELWNTTTPLENNDFNTMKSLIENGEKIINIEEFRALDKHGEYSVEFLYVLMQLLASQEKTNREDAYMFGAILDELLEIEIDIFATISKASYGGKK
jgi:hypothetical protein